MNDLSKAAITCITHGYTETLVKNGLKPEWLEDNDARVVTEVAFDLYRRNKKINALSILVEASGKLEDVQQVRHLFSLNGTGDVPAESVVRQVRDSHLVGQTQKLKNKMSSLMDEKPTEIAQWLPVMSQQMQSLTLQGRAYDPRPSSHMGNIVPPVKFKSKHPTFNRMFEGEAGDGGGYRSHWFNVWIGPTGRGKTTNGYTIGEDACLQHRRISWIAKENQSQVTARLLLALTHLTFDEINSGKAEDFDGDADKYGRKLVDESGSDLQIYNADGETMGPWRSSIVRQWLLDTWLKSLDETVRIYDWRNHFREDLSLVKNVVSWDDPDILIVDFIGPDDTQTQQKVYGLGAIAAGLEDLSHSTGVNTNSFWQMSNTEEKAYIKNKLYVVDGPYGSGMVKQSGDGVIQSRKGDFPDRQTYLKTKDRAGGRVEDFEMFYDKHRWVYTEPPALRDIF